MSAEAPNVRPGPGAPLPGRSGCGQASRAAPAPSWSISRAAAITQPRAMVTVRGTAGIGHPQGARGSCRSCCRAPGGLRGSRSMHDASSPRQARSSGRRTARPSTLTTRLT
jgi:hypothetical protein